MPRSRRDYAYYDAENEVEVFSFSDFKKNKSRRNLEKLMSKYSYLTEEDNHKPFRFPNDEKRGIKQVGFVEEMGENQRFQMNLTGSIKKTEGTNFDLVKEGIKSQHDYSHRYGKFAKEPPQDFEKTLKGMGLSLMGVRDFKSLNRLPVSDRVKILKKVGLI